MTIIGSTCCHFCVIVPFSLVSYTTRDQLQGSKLGWSCGPCLPNLQSDHQIVIGGGPVVYWKLAIKEQYSAYFKQINWQWHRSFVCLHIFFSKFVLCIASIVQMLCTTRKGKLCQLCLI